MNNPTSNLQVIFALPQHGWLPVQIIYGTIVVEFEASDVPNNPVADLLAAIWAVGQGNSALVEWHLEPTNYYFEFTPHQKDIELRILHRGITEASSSEEYVIRGNKQKVLMPFWRALRKLEVSETSETDWPYVSYRDLELIKKIIQSDTL
jgi:hypothetical protein